MIPRSALRRFLPSVLALLCLALSTASSLRAEGEVKFPADGSSIRFTPPVGWKISHEDDGTMICTAPDAQYFFALISGKDDIHDMYNELPGVARTLGDKSKLTDTDAGHSSEWDNHNGLKIFIYSFKGKRDGQDIDVVAAGLVPAKGDTCILLCVATPKAQEAHDNAMRAVMRSLKTAAD